MLGKRFFFSYGNLSIFVITYLPKYINFTEQKMKRQYLSQNVYEALQLRLHFLFEEFDNILVSFSGGKDSGLLLNLVMGNMKRKSAMSS